MWDQIVARHAAIPASAVADRVRVAIGKVPDALWQNVINTDGTARDLDDAGVVELAGLLRESVGPDGKVLDQLKTWPKDLRVIVRRERPHPGAQLSLFEEADGWRYQVFATLEGHRTHMVSFTFHMEGEAKMHRQAITHRHDMTHPRHRGSRQARARRAPVAPTRRDLHRSRHGDTSGRT